MLPLAWDQQFHLVLRTSLFSETANLIHSAACMFVYLGGKQTTRQISIPFSVRRGQGDIHAYHAVFALLPVNSEEEFGVGWVIFWFCGWLVWGFLIKPR